MIMPFLRLVVIYIVVILAALLVFKRDSVMSLMGMPWGGDKAEMSTAVDDTPPPVSAPVVDANATAATAATAASAATDAPVPAGDNTAPVATAQTTEPPKYPTNETAQTAPPAPTPNAPTTAPAAAPTAAPTAASDIQTRLDQARKTYWNRDITGAETLYKSLAADAPANADIKGELGNLYYSQRRMSEAAQMYHQTGVQLIKDGNTRQIMPLIGVLQSIAPDMANDLRSRLSQ